MRCLIMLFISMYPLQTYALINLALNKLVWEDNPWKGYENWKGQNAVDGKRDDRSAHGGQCVISENGWNKATLGVDLGNVVSISHIDIYYRTENLTRCRDYRYYGYNCNLRCPKNCQERRCDINTGHCLGCIPGYKGTNCSQDCGAHTYGLGCSSICGNCSGGETCNPVNGSCPSECDRGVQGEKCQDECQLGYYGENCRNQCSVNCNVTSRCDRFTGSCNGGCKPGWTGNTCDQSEYIVKEQIN